MLHILITIFKVSESGLNDMCTFSSSAQYDIVYLYYYVSIKCTLLLCCGIHYGLYIKYNVIVHLEIIMTACYCSSS